jgi:hypothetical protein
VWLPDNTRTDARRRSFFSPTLFDTVEDRMLDIIRILSNIYNDSANLKRNYPAIDPKQERAAELGH